jgi:hypothetical protein
MADAIEQAQADLDAARTAHASAAQAVEDAQARFDASGSDADLKRVRTAKEATSEAAERVARAERLLERAREDAEAARRAALERKRDELLARVSSHAVSEAADPLAREEAEALARVARIRLQRLELANQHRVALLDLGRVLKQLGEADYGGARKDHSSAFTSPLPVHEHLDLLAPRHELDEIAAHVWRHVRPDWSVYP